MINNASMEQVNKFEIETLRNTLKDCIDLLYKYGFTFEKEDRDKATTLIAMVKNKEELEELYARWIDDTKEQLLRKAQ